MYSKVSCQYMHVYARIMHYISGSDSRMGKLPLIPAGDHGTIPRSMHGRKDACYKLGVCDRQGEPGSGSPLFYINTWAMVWPNDYPALAT